MFEDLKSRILAYGSKRSRLVVLREKTKTYRTKLSMSEKFRHDQLYKDIMLATSYLPCDCDIPFRLKCIFSNITEIPRCHICGNMCRPMKDKLSIKYPCFCSTCDSPVCRAKHASSFVKMTNSIRLAHSVAQKRHKRILREVYAKLIQRYKAGDFNDVQKDIIINFCQNRLACAGRNGQILKERDFIENSDILCSLIKMTNGIVSLDIDKDRLFSISVCDFRFNERIYCILKDITRSPKCRYCGGDVSFIGIRSGYAVSCPECMADKYREKRGFKTSLQILKDIDKQKYDVISFPKKVGVDKLVVKCRKCGYTSEWWSGNGFLQSLRGKQLCKNCEIFESRAECEVARYVMSICDSNVLRNDRNLISPQELDVFIQDRHVAIEFDGLYYHSDAAVKPRYHAYKTQRCASRGVQLIHVFENEWMFRRAAVEREISYALGIQNVSYTLSDNIRFDSISEHEYRQFQRLNSMVTCSQPGAKIFYGLFDGQSIVACMAIIPRYNHEYDIYGICSKIGFDRDAVSKLIIDKFEKTQCPSKIRLFADRRLAKPKFISQLGCHLMYNTKIRGWLFPVSGIKNEFDMIPDDSVNTANDKKILTGYRRIFDCGNYVFEKVYS